jgi:hypothetical protein
MELDHSGAGMHRKVLDQALSVDDPGCGTQIADVNLYLTVDTEADIRTLESVDKAA